ncbi:MAG: M4 family metallopeptidase, partial [Nocardioides sp.]
MKPMLTSALALGCVSAALVASAGTSQAATSATHPSARASSVQAARANAEEHAGVGRGQALTVRDTILDRDGDSHVRFTRTFHGLPVVGGDFVVHQASGG